MLSSLYLKMEKSAVVMTSRIAHRVMENKNTFFISCYVVSFGTWIYDFILRFGFWIFWIAFGKGFVDEYSIRIYTERILTDWRGF